jgi:hypothetical protein
MSLSEEEIKKAFMRNAVSFVLSEFPKEVDIMDIPTLVEYVDKRILVWEPFARRSGIELADIIDQLFEMNYSTYLDITGGGAPQPDNHPE